MYRHTTYLAHDTHTLIRDRTFTPRIQLSIYQYTEQPRFHVTNSRTLA
jgi:hypothetical protein